MSKLGTMLVFHQDDRLLLEYLNSLYKESPSGEPTEPVVRAIQTVNRAGRRIGVVKLGRYFQKDSKVVRLIIDALVKMNMPIKIESGNREVENEDFARYLELNDKVIIVEARKTDGETEIAKYGGREFKKRFNPQDKARFPALIYWLETQAICPEVIVFDIHSPPWKESETEDIAYSILREIVE